jgi:hypothetical protein
MRGKSRAGRLVAATLAMLLIGAGVAHADTPADESTGGIAGRLVDQNGIGVADADVFVDGEDHWHWAHTITDADGNFELLELIPDNYRVEFQAPDAPVQYAFGNASWNDADLIAVVADEITIVDDQLLPTGVISGSLTDSDGDGVSAIVFAQPDGGGAWMWADTDEDGFFSMHVLAGDYRVRFETDDDFVQFAHGTTEFFEAEVFSVAAGQTVTVHDQLLTPGIITGQLVDADGNGVVDAQVRTEPEDDGTWAHTWTEEDGEFSLAVLPGQYRVTFMFEGMFQYAHGTTSWSQAEVFTVEAGSTVTVNDTLITPGAVAGVFTDGNGDGIGEVEVFLEPLDGAGDWGEAFTDDEGHYEFPVVAPGDYHVSFHDWDDGFIQYAFGALTRSEAAVISVVAGETAVVNDSLLPTGSVRITGLDVSTGEPVMQFEAQLAGRFGATQDGELIITDVPVGTHDFQWVSAAGYSHLETVSVTVAAGMQAEVVLALHPRARIETTVVDTQTGEPVAGVCLITATATRFRMPEWCPHVSGPDGQVIVEVPQAGTYQLLAWPRDAHGYGAQWVGSEGGTGEQGRAVKVTVPDGGVATAPIVRMDPAGVVTGVVTDTDGQPVTSGFVRMGHDGIGIGFGLGQAWIHEDGSYSLGGLGPYEWPLVFDVWDHPTQWSGGTADRSRADGVPVVAGQSTTFDYQLVAGTSVSLAIAGDAWDREGFVVALNARTGDRVGVWWQDPAAELGSRPVLGPQRVKFVFVAGPEEFFGGDDFASARRFPIRPHGEHTITLR